MKNGWDFIDAKRKGVYVYVSTAIVQGILAMLNVGIALLSSDQ